jgi:hypothetical protein
MGSGDCVAMHEYAGDEKDDPGKTHPQIGGSEHR